MMKSKAVILILLLIICSCSEGRKETESLLSKFANDHNAEWVPVISAMQFENDSKLRKNTFEVLPAVEADKIKEVAFEKTRKLPDLYVLKKLERVNLGLNQIENIYFLSGLNIKEVYLTMCPVNSLLPLENCIQLEKIDAGGTLIETLPDFSRLQHLKELRLDQTKITSLDGIEKIDHPFDLYIMWCEQLQDIEALKYSKVQNLYIDKSDPEVYEAKEGTYDRFKEWFRANMAVIKQNNPSFEIKYEIEAGL